MSGPFQFGVCRKRLNPLDVIELEAIAAEHGCAFICAEYETGPIAWFEGPGQGEPFDSATRGEVLLAIAASGIAYEVVS